MKKTYIQPNMTVIETRMNVQLLAGSNPAVGGTTNDPNDLLAPEFDFYE